MALGIALSHDGLAKRTFLYALATFVCVCTNVNVEVCTLTTKVSVVIVWPMSLNFRAAL